MIDFKDIFYPTWSHREHNYVLIGADFIWICTMSIAQKHIIRIKTKHEDQTLNIPVTEE